MNVPLNVINLLTWCSDDYTDGEVDEPFHFNRPVPGRYPRAGKLTRSFIFEGLQLVQRSLYWRWDWWTLPFQPTGPGTLPPGRGTNSIIHFWGSSHSFLRVFNWCKDHFTDGEVGEPFHFNPPVPGRYPRAGGLKYFPSFAAVKIGKKKMQVIICLTNDCLHSFFANFYCRERWKVL